MFNIENYNISINLKNDILFVKVVDTISLITYQESFNNNSKENYDLLIHYLQNNNIQINKTSNSLTLINQNLVFNIKKINKKYDRILNRDYIVDEIFKNSDYNNYFALNIPYYHYTSLCNVTFNLFVFLEKYYTEIKNDLYHSIPSSIDKLIDMLKEISIDKNEYLYKCDYDCAYGYASRIFVLDDEYEEILNSIDSLSNDNERYYHRMSNFNFIDLQNCEHNRHKMIAELETWKKYFHKKCLCEHGCCYCKNITCEYYNEISNTLKNIPSDCIQLIYSYLY